MPRLEHLVHEERVERRRDIDRIERAIETMAAMSPTIAKLATSMEHFAERLTDHQRATEVGLHAITKQVERLDTKIDNKGSNHDH